MKDKICCVIGFEDSLNYLETAKKVYYKARELVQKGVKKFIIGLYVQQFTCTEILRMLKKEFNKIELFCVMNRDQYLVKNKEGFSAQDYLSDFKPVLIDAKKDFQEIVYMINISNFVLFYSSKETINKFENEYVKFTNKKENYNCWVE